MRWKILALALILAGAVLHPFLEPLPEPGGRPRRADLARPAFGAGFEPNVGQSASPALFLARGGRASSFFTRDGLTVSMQASDGVDVAVRMRLLGADPAVVVRGDQPLPGKSHYFLGNDPSQRRSDVPRFRRVRYERIYAGVDLVYYRNGEGLLEYDFEIRAEADPAPVAFAFDGADEVRVTPSGDLALVVGEHRLIHRRPEAYQLRGDRRIPVEAAYQVNSDQEVRFQLGVYDRSLPLVIDPVFDTRFPLGGSGNDDTPSVYMDDSGRIFLALETNSLDFPTTLGAYDRIQNRPDGAAASNDVAVAVVSSDGRFFEFSTFIGGSGEDKPQGFGRRIAVDGQGRIVVVGWTESADFPTTPGALQESPQGDRDLFALMLSPDGSELLYSTYIGGTGDDGFPSLALGAEGDVYIGAQTDSDRIPTTLGALDQTFNGVVDVYVARLRMGGSGVADLLYGTYFGGTGDDRHASIALDADGVIHVLGETDSSDFTTTNNAFDRSYNGGADGGEDPGDDLFLWKIDPQGNGADDLVYSTYFGGSGEDDFDALAPGLAVLPDGDVWFTGETLSRPDDPTPIPLTPDALDRTINIGDDGADDLILVRLRPAGAGQADLIYSSYYGGAGNDVRGTIAVDGQGVVYLAGETDGNDLPVLDAVQSANAGEDDVFVAALTQGGRTLAFASYLGDAGDDGDPNLWVNDEGLLIASEGAVAGGARDVYVDKIVDFGFLPGVRSFSTVSAAGFGRRVAAGSIVSGFGSELAARTVSATSLPLPTTLADASLEIVDSAGGEHSAQIFFASAGQINYFLPEGLPSGLAIASVWRGDRVVARGSLNVQRVAPALFTLPGQNAAAGSFLFIGSDGNRTQRFLFDAQSRPVAVDLGVDGDEVYLLLFGTGIRNFTTAATATVNDVAVPVVGAVPQGAFVGLDQVNLGPLPRALIGAGLSEVIVVVDGVESAPVEVLIR